MTAVRPRDAASLILLDYKGKKPYVLMGKRHPGHAFMPSKFVFPGGRLEALDRRILVSGALDLRVESKLCEKVTKSTSVKARVAIEAGISQGWHEWVGNSGAIIGINEFGASGSAAALFKKFGFTIDNVIATVKKVMAND